MGIKIKNATDHSTIAIIMSYLPAPTPSLFYRRVLVLPPGTRDDSPTWQCPGVIYAFEPPKHVNAEQVAAKLRRAMARFNVVRAGLCFAGGQLMDFLDMFGGIFDAVLELIVETVVDMLTASLEDSGPTDDESWDNKIKDAFSHGDDAGDDDGDEKERKDKTKMVRSMFLLGFGGMGLRRQHSLERRSKDNYALSIRGDGIAFFRVVAFAAHRDLAYVRNQWAIWLGNHIAVPISTSSALPERVHVLTDSGASHVIAHAKMDTSSLPVPTLHPSSPVPSTDDDLTSHLLNHEAFSNEVAMLLYTSSTTGPPKGVLATHASLCAQVDDIATAWEFTSADRVVHFLPLHHTSVVFP
ncbi:hypothetical protein DYB25_009491 [Aphanomyces astaci]|uniref:AMP-dependent synthetase/ligase domain-containing protein n=1 Tax=Aphanomyces astaci TaxID=112090 RepID=A0A397API4_APHAT|nr:hypothetical protein DYB25_009491 [Aphanomyces astaci]